MSCEARVPSDGQPGFSRTALRIAWRELWASPAKFIFVVLAVAAGVGALTGVRGFSESFRGMLLQKARTLMAADVSATEFGSPTADQVAALDRLQARGVRMTRITHVLTMGSSASKPEPVMMAVKAVDPAVYPFYGTVKLQPDRPLATLLNDSTVVAGEDVLIRTGTKLGDTLRIGGQDFRVAGIVISEPDRMTVNGSFNFGLRVMITRGGLDRTGLIIPGSRATQRYLFRLPAQGVTVAQVKHDLNKVFPESQVVDYRESNPTVTRGLDDATTFLSIVSLIALIVGALGVAMAMNAHLQQHMDGIAVMKSIGARSSQVIRIYAFETAILGTAGAVLGIIGGYGVERIFPHLIDRYFKLHVDLAFGWGTIAQGLAIGLLTTMLFTLPPLLRIRRVRPGVILRRNMTEGRERWWKRWKESIASLAMGAAILAGMGSIAGWLSNSRQVGLFFLIALVVGLVSLSVVAWLLLRGLRWFQRSASLRLPGTVRHGIANLYRPGNQAQSVLVALGVGVMFITSVYLVQHSVVTKMMENTPAGMPNVFLIDIQPLQRDGVERLIRRLPGMDASLEIVPVAQVRLTAIDGVALQSRKLQGFERRFLRSRGVTPAAGLPPGVVVLKGAWWKSGSTEPLMAIEEEAARVLKVGPGSMLDFDTVGRTIRVRIAAVYRSERFRMGGLTEFTFTPATLAGLPAIDYGGVHVKPESVGRLQRALYETYPTITVVSVAEALSVVQEVVDQVALVLRFLSVFAILAGVIILAASVAGTRFRRIREVVILKTLGGTRRKIAGVFTVEFLIIGLVAGLMGGLLANGFANVILTRSFEAVHISFHPWVVVVAMVATALVADATGWLASFRILGQKPLEVLREE
jgi:putative ABC transport system permease protein